MSRTSGSGNNLYKRAGSPFWWVRVVHCGKKYRRSTGKTELGEAKDARNSVLKLLVFDKRESDEWNAHVDEHLASSNSWLRRTHRRIAGKSAKRGWCGRVSLLEMENLMRWSNGKCALTGLPFSKRVLPIAGRDPYAISIDRIDSALGYVAGNCRLVLLGVNISMQQWGEKDLLLIAKALLEKSKQVYTSGTAKIQLLHVEQ